MTIRVRHRGEEREFGDMADVRTALGDGRLEPADEIWHALTETWRPLSDVPTAAARDGGAPAASPPPSSAASTAPPTPPSGTAAPAEGPAQPAQAPVLRVPAFLRRPAVLIAVGAVVVALLVLVVVLLAGRGRQGDRGAGAGGADATCEKIACSGHGNCVVVRGEPTCACEDEYHAEGLNCVRMPAPYIPSTELPRVRPQQPLRRQQGEEVAPDPASSGSSEPIPGYNGYRDLACQLGVRPCPGPPPGQPPTCAQTCQGCCDGERCLPGRSVAACGMGGEPCVRCWGGSGMRVTCDGTCISEWVGDP